MIIHQDLNCTGFIYEFLYYERRWHIIYNRKCQHMTVSDADNRTRFTVSGYAKFHKIFREHDIESTSKGKAQILNAQYASVFQDEGKSKPPDLGNSPYPSMPKIDVSIEGVKKLLLRLNPKKAVGPDMVPTHILRDYADDIAPILQSIFQQSLDTGMVPEDWKKANVTAVFKKGSRQVASNYRPVSLTCVSCKVLEHIVFRAIMDHVDFHKILVFFQHGFRSKHSCETQLVNTIEDLAKGLNDKQQLDLLILDFSKAFDLVAHKRLLSKLQYCGIHDQTLTWIKKNWLTGRTQCVVVDGESSEDTSVRSGPKGVRCPTGYSARPLNVYPIHQWHRPAY